jgi:putative glutamine amidotransferase
MGEEPGGTGLTRSAAPLIAVPAYHLHAGRVSRWSSGAYAVPEKYVDALRRAGAEPVLVPPGGPGADELAAPFDGLLLIGGGDVDPALYGSTDPHPDVYGVDTDRDVAEMELIKKAAGIGLPILAICRGIQVLNVAFGGTLFQHLPERSSDLDHRQGHPERLHDVRVTRGSRLFVAVGGTSFSCASRHHQGLDRLGDGLIPVGWAHDGLVEAVEHRDGWMVGVQWHPEVTADRDPAQQALFDALAREARRRTASMS